MRRAARDSTQIVPPSANNNVAGLSRYLVPKYIAAIPEDPHPSDCSHNYTYLSDKKNYELLLHLEGIDGTKYSDHWCVGAHVGSLADYQDYLPCR
jgi:hypothetical protein